MKVWGREAFFTLSHRPREGSDAPVGVVSDKQNIVSNTSQLVL